MSKFCGVISTENGRKFEPFQFHKLELLTDYLINETQGLQNDFETKGLHVREQQNRIDEHERTLIKIHEEVAKLNTNMCSLEQEVESNDSLLQNLTTNVARLEFLMDDSSNPLPRSPCKPDERSQMCELLKLSNVVMSELAAIMENVTNYEKCVQLHTSCYDIVVQILDLHVRVMQQTDWNMSSLVDKSRQVENAFGSALAASAGKCDLLDDSTAGDALQKLTESINKWTKTQPAVQRSGASGIDRLL